jgi:hypothetical protein
MCLDTGNAFSVRRPSGKGEVKVLMQGGKLWPRTKAGGVLLQVVLAANSGATINDITAAELQPLLLVAAEGDKFLSESLASGKLKVVSSGNDMPVIDISKVGGCLNSFE